VWSSEFNPQYYKKKLCKWNCMSALGFFSIQDESLEMHPGCYMWVAHSLLLLCSVPCYGCITVCLISYSVKDIRITSSLGLQWVKMLWLLQVLETLMYRILCEHKSSLLCKICPEVWVLDSVVVTSLLFQETVNFLKFLFPRNCVKPE
jgi:hypothetical protein